MRAALLPTFGALSAALCLEARADAVALPPLALGNASFMDGVSRPGMLFELPLQYVRANNASDAGGHSVPGRQRVRGTTLLPHFAYLSQNTLLGAHYGAEVLLPLVRLDLDIDGGPDGRRTRQGDLIVSPLMLQWGPATLFGPPLLAAPELRLLPAHRRLRQGRRDQHRQQHLDLQPALRLHLGTGRAPGTQRPPALRLDQPQRRPLAAPGRKRRTAGPGAARELLDLLRAGPRTGGSGLAGYQLKQISADRNRRPPAGRLAASQVFGIGPGVMYSQGRQTLFANLYAESGARNRSEGNQLTLRYLLAF
ncbi:hypothetical protein PACG_01331 [Pseudomonas aeruginosa C3719]|nr:hypothetical protein PACG_01331 [Pseudomonas aeruginosa C3719]